MANYTETHLLRGEEIAYQTSYHWMHYFTLQGFFSLFIIPLVQQYTDEFVITNKRVIVKKGLIAIWTLEMNLQKIETVIFTSHKLICRIQLFSVANLKNKKELGLKSLLK